MYDHFVARLGCPVCGRTSEPTSETGMQTKIRPAADGSYLGIGVETGATEQEVATHYTRLRSPEPGGKLHILQGWHCEGNHEACPPQHLWAEIVLHGGITVSISNVPMNRSTLERIHYIDEDIDTIVRRTLGIALTNEGMARPDAIDVILKGVQMQERAMAESE